MEQVHQGQQLHQEEQHQQVRSLRHSPPALVVSCLDVPERDVVLDLWRKARSFQDSDVHNFNRRFASPALPLLEEVFQGRFGDEFVVSDLFDSPIEYVFDSILEYGNRTRPPHIQQQLKRALTTLLSYCTERDFPALEDDFPAFASSTENQEQALEVVDEEQILTASNLPYHVQQQVSYAASHSDDPTNFCTYTHPHRHHQHNASGKHQDQQHINSSKGGGRRYNQNQNQVHNQIDYQLPVAVDGAGGNPGRSFSLETYHEHHNKDHGNGTSITSRRATSGHRKGSLTPSQGELVLYHDYTPASATNRSAHTPHTLTPVGSVGGSGPENPHSNKVLLAYGGYRGKEGSTATGVVSFTGNGRGVDDHYTNNKYNLLSFPNNTNATLGFPALPPGGLSKGDREHSGGSSRSSKSNGTRATLLSRSEDFQGDFENEQYFFQDTSHGIAKGAAPAVPPMINTGVGGLCPQRPSTSRKTENDNDSTSINSIRDQNSHQHQQPSPGNHSPTPRRQISAASAGSSTYSDHETGVFDVVLLLRKNWFLSTSAVASMRDRQSAQHSRSGVAPQQQCSCSSEMEEGNITKSCQSSPDCSKSTSEQISCHKHPKTDIKGDNTPIPNRNNLHNYILPGYEYEMNHNGVGEIKSLTRDEFEAVHHAVQDESPQFPSRPSRPPVFFLTPPDRDRGSKPPVSSHEPPGSTSGSSAIRLGGLAPNATRTASSQCSATALEALKQRRCKALRELPEIVVESLLENHRTNGGCSPGFAGRFVRDMLEILAHLAGIDIYEQKQTTTGG
ncbi:unnamed protein product [Amoebophrya sp. A25]|nr:unnamed protein product [Amoebophrya sp. A25]|eukprot:GSA25T00015758001.1